MKLINFIKRSHIFIFLTMGVAIIVAQPLFIAALYYTALEAESGTLNGQAVKLSDNTASASAYIQFGATAPPTDGFLSGSVFQSSWSINNTSGWSNEVSGAMERFVTRSTHLECHAGGYAASTHYARVRRKLPERDDLVFRKRFSIESTFELPANFYTQHQSYMRLITTDNFPGTFSSTGMTIGSNDPNEWRVGFTIYGSDGLFRLISDHENNSNIVLWKSGSRLEPGLHKVKINFAPSTTNAGAWELFIDDSMVGSGNNIQTVPSSVNTDDILITRVGACIDGASAQDTKSISVNLHSIVVRAER